MMKENVGTSPRAWGEGSAGEVAVEFGRNIPTGVGRRLGEGNKPSGTSEHPHGRGEKVGLPERNAGDGGTSPRAWGEGPVLLVAAPDLRNIPTGVGRRVRQWRATMAAPEHPHGRGEKAAEMDTMPVQDGTSPRAWGEEPRARGG